MSMCNGHEHDLIPPCTWLGHVGQIGGSREVAIALGCKGKEDVRVALQPAEGFHPHCEMVGLVASEVVCHGPEHAVAILANHIADLEAIQVVQCGSQDRDAMHCVEKGLGLQWLAGWQCDCW